MNGPKRILLPAHRDHGLDTRLTVAAALAQQFGGTLECVYAHVPPGAGQAISAGGMERLAEEEDREAARLRRTVESQLSEDAVRWTWHPDRGNIVDAIIEHAPMADLIVASPMIESGGGSMVEPIAELLLLRAPAPLMIAPTDTDSFDPTGTAMIAWNGSAESARAMRLALPILRAASDVHLVTAAADIRRFTAQDAADYLRDHGVESRIETTTDGGKNAAKALCKSAESLGADYIVMGGYSRSRVNEFIFGGVTRHMLRHPPLPLFIVH